MHIKLEYNFFSGQETKKTQNQVQTVAIIAACAVLLVGAVALFLWGRVTLANDERRLADARAMVNDPVTLAKMQEVDVKQAQIDNLASYTSLAGILLERIDDAKYASTANLAALLALIPDSVQVDALDIQGVLWHLECKTAVQADIAVLLHNVVESDVFGQPMVGSIQVDEAGLNTFPLDLMLKGGTTDAAE